MVYEQQFFLGVLARTLNFKLGPSLLAQQFFFIFSNASLYLDILGF
jgi:hypothetical protein